MDNIIAESETTMINSLNFGLPETAQYITDRRHVNYFPSGSNVYNPNAGNKNIRFHISGEDNTYIDLSSIRLFASVLANGVMTGICSSDTIVNSSSSGAYRKGK